MVCETSISYSVIDAWADVLNHEENYRSPYSLFRFFGSIQYLSHSDILSNTSHEDLWLKFRRILYEDLHRHQIEDDLRRIDLLFIPVAQSEHFYLLVLNFVRPGVLILDNSDAEEGNREKYIGIPERLQADFVMRCLDLDGLHIASQFRAVDPERWRMHCRTSNNKTDCGIFVM